MWSFYLISLLVGVLLASDTYRDAEARNRLKRVGINIDSESKISLDRIRVNSINGLIDFKKDSKCNIVVLGGTESGHVKGEKSHDLGYRIDVKHNSCIDDYIQQKCEPFGKRKDGTILFKCKSAVLAFERNHWDVLFH